MLAMLLNVFEKYHNFISMNHFSSAYARQENTNYFSFHYENRQSKLHHSGSKGNSRTLTEFD